MVGKILKAYAYSKAPRTTFAVKHPVKTARLVKFRWDIKHAWAPRVAAVGAAALVLPLGMALGRVGRNRTNGRHED